MEDVKVSIIIPTYNCAQWLPETIDSVLAQTYRNYELLIVDDGSTDNTKEVVQPYLSFGKIRYLHQENSGQASARNHGLRLATGKYVAYLDSDDTWAPHKLEKQINLLEEQDAQVCYTGVNLIDENSLLTEYSPKGALAFRRGVVLDYLFVDNFVPFSSVVVEKRCLELVGGSNISIKKSDDWDLLLRLSVFCRFDYIGERLMNYRVLRPGQITSDTFGRFQSVNDIANNFVLNNPGLISNKKIKLAYAYRYRAYAQDICTKGVGKSMLYYLFSFKYDPFSLKPFVGIARCFFKFVFGSSGIWSLILMQKK